VNVTTEASRFTVVDELLPIVMATIKLQGHLTMTTMMTMAGYHLKIGAIGMIMKTDTVVYIVIGGDM